MNSKSQLRYHALRYWGKRPTEDLQLKRLRLIVRLLAIEDACLARGRGLLTPGVRKALEMLTDG